MHVNFLSKFAHFTYKMGTFQNFIIQRTKSKVKGNNGSFFYIFTT